MSYSEAQRMLDNEIARRTSRLKAPLEIQLLALDRAERRSPASITKSEMVANALAQTSFEGAQSRTACLSEQRKRDRELSGRQAEDFVELAQAKVELWPLIGDTKAVRVRPRA